MQAGCLAGPFRWGVAACLAAAMLAAAARAETGTLAVKVTDEAGRPLAARVHLRDASGKYVLPPGEPSKRNTAHGGPFADEYWHTAGELSLAVEAGPAVITVSHGLHYEPADQTFTVRTGEVTSGTMVLRRMVDLAAAGWYSGDIHLHRQLGPEGFLAEDINVGLFPHCHNIFGKYVQGLSMAECPDGLHLRSAATRASRVHAIEGNCFMWDLPRPIALALGDEAWPEPIDPSAGADWRKRGYLQPFVYRAAHEAGGTVVGYPHDTRRRLPAGYYPLIVAMGWMDAYSVLDNVLAKVANEPDDGRFEAAFESQFRPYYAFLNCGFRLPATGGSDLTAVGSSLWPGYNRTFVKVDGPFTFKAWKEGIRAGRTFVTNRPLLFVTANGREAGAEFALRGQDGPSVTFDIEVVSATPVDRIEVLGSGQVLKSIAPDPPARRLKTRETVPVARSMWLAVRCFGRGGNRNIEPRRAIAHTSPWYALVDARPIRSAEDARYFRDLLKARVAADLPTIENEKLRTALETMAAEALDRYPAP